MAGSRGTRLTGAALRCYPAGWRRRHGDEAAELAMLLIRDGTPAIWIAGSYLAGAAREWLLPRPGKLVSAAACALLVAAGALGVSVGLLAPAAPARAASTSQVPRATHCRPSSRAPVPAVPPAVGTAQVAIWAAGHGQSC
ncbi:MAG TPA: hypothetical protein VG164_08160 [Trebonia sp.]|jgi:hypothetical protein|nr:hypothetical protein [Trebonia sp.]